MEGYIALLQGVFYLILVTVAVIVIIRLVANRFSFGLHNYDLKVLARVPLDGRSGSGLVLVQLGAQALLLGVSPRGVTLLKEIPADLVLAEVMKDSAAPGEKAVTNFAKILKHWQTGKVDR